MYYIYVLLSLKDRKLYIGMTSNLNERVKNHNAGKSTATRNRRPLQLIYYEFYHYKSDAEQREKYLKGGNGRASLKIQLTKQLEVLKYKHRL